MSRETKPAPPARPRYPRLRAAWRLLAAPIALAPLEARADLNLPVPSDGKTPAQATGTKHAPEVIKVQGGPPAVQPLPHPHPRLGGKPAHVDLDELLDRATQDRKPAPQPAPAPQPLRPAPVPRPPVEPQPFLGGVIRTLNLRPPAAHATERLATATPRRPLLVLHMHAPGEPCEPLPPGAPHDDDTDEA